jgi:hypothetical protein
MNKSGILRNIDNGNKSKILRILSPIETIDYSLGNNLKSSGF